MKVFCPLITQSSPSFLACVRRLDTSEPAPGSVTQNEERWMSSAVPKHCGTHSAICSGVPLPAMPAAPRVLPKIASEIPASPQHISSLTIGKSSPVGSEKHCAMNSHE